ncbi:MAG: hypothetical protein CENE_00160 [Candidatus Celerinatantimonas neptuna]|nr:MAG: hypothetical protein CENE_00160 [Candidatus Celerinatantimonas neptuna]
MIKELEKSEYIVFDLSIQWSQEDLRKIRDYIDDLNRDYGANTISYEIFIHKGDESAERLIDYYLNGVRKENLVYIVTDNTTFLCFINSGEMVLNKWMKRLIRIFSQSLSFRDRNSLSVVQYEMAMSYFHSDNTYAITKAFELVTDKVDEYIVKRITDVMNSHTILSTAYLIDDRIITPIFRENNDAICKLFYKDKMMGGSDKEVISGLISRHSEFCLKLEQSPAFVGVLKMSETRYIVIMKLSHICIDGIGLDFLVKEIETAIHEPDYIPYKSDYSSYAEEQYNTRLSKKMIHKVAMLHQFYEHLGLMSYKLELPGDMSTGFRQQYNGPETERIKRVCQHSGASLFVIYLTAYMVTLLQTFDEDLIAIRTSFGNRKNNKMHKTVGCFTNTLFVLLSSQYKANYKESLLEIRDQMSMLMEFENVDLADLTFSMKAESAVMASHMLGNISFAYIKNYQGKEVGLKNLNFWDEKERTYPLRLVVEESLDRNIIINITYNEGAFEAGGKPAVLAESYMENLNHIISSFS